LPVSQFFNPSGYIALTLAEAFDTTPQFWLNLQQKYDLWIKEHEHEHVRPIVKNGELVPSARDIAIAACSLRKE
jgi:plasmid maintenance system antidote protein VapI